MRKRPAAITLMDAQYEEGKTAVALNCSTTVGDNGTISYQWYSSDAVDNFNGTVMDGETSETFTPPTTAVGTYYYYVVATNTKTDATGEKTAATRSNMATITVTTKPVTYTVSYDWGAEFPDGETLPTDHAVYQSVQDAEAAMDKTYTASSTSNAQKDGKDGTWTFSGWSANVEGTVVTFTGTWTFTEKETPVTPKPPVTPSRPSTPAKPSQNPNVRPTLPFTDVVESAWYKDAVRYVYENGIMSGTAANTFEPDTNTTRGMIATMLHRMDGKPGGKREQSVPRCTGWLFCKRYPVGAAGRNCDRHQRHRVRSECAHDARAACGGAVPLCEVSRQRHCQSGKPEQLHRRQYSESLRPRGNVVGSSGGHPERR